MSDSNNAGNEDEFVEQRMFNNIESIKNLLEKLVSHFENQCQHSRQKMGGTICNICDSFESFNASRDKSRKMESEYNND